MNSLVKIAALTAVVVSLGGCASAYECQLGNACQSVTDSYHSAVKNAGNVETTAPGANVAGVPLDDEKDDVETAGKKVGFQSFSPYQGGALDDKPVYQPPRPLRIWIAPWREKTSATTQNNAVLISGQFMYATVPGGWTMGTLREGGGLSPILMLAPQHPKDKVPKRIQPKQKLVDMPALKTKK